MPRLHKLTPAEIAALARTDSDARAQLAAHYDVLLAPFAIGDYGLAEPEPGETRLAVRRRLAAAAEQRGWVLVFVPSGGRLWCFGCRRKAELAPCSVVVE